MSLVDANGNALSNEKALAHPIHEYFDFVAPKEEDGNVYFRFNQGRYDGLVFHYVFDETFEASGAYKVVLDLVPKRFEDRDPLREDLCQRMVREFMHDIMSQAIQQQADAQVENYARQPSDPKSDPPQPDQQ